MKAKKENKAAYTRKSTPAKESCSFGDLTVRGACIVPVTGQDRITTGFCLGLICELASGVKPMTLQQAVIKARLVSAAKNNPFTRRTWPSEYAALIALDEFCGDFGIGVAAIESGKIDQIASGELKEPERAKAKKGENPDFADQLIRSIARAAKVEARLPMIGGAICKALPDIRSLQAVAAVISDELAARASAATDYAAKMAAEAERAKEDRETARAQAVKWREEAAKNENAAARAKHEERAAKLEAAEKRTLALARKRAARAAKISAAKTK